jgi:hypothetical protein
VNELVELLALERGQAEELRAALGRGAEELRAATATRDAALRSLSPADLHPESESLARVLMQLQRASNAVSDELTLKFFSHAASRSVLSLVA